MTWLFTAIVPRFLRNRLGLASTNGNGSGRPPTGSALSQLFGESKIAGEVRRIIGAFNPRLVGLRERLLMRNDPDVAFGLAILRAPIVNLRWSVESKDPVIAAFVEAQLRPKYRQFAKAASNAIGFGYQVVEKVWGAKPFKVQVEDKAAGTTAEKSFPMAWTIDRFKAIDPRTIALLVDETEDKWSGVQQLPPKGKAKPDPVGPERVVLWSFRDEDVFGRLDGYPILDQAYEPWYWKAAMNLFANRYFERRADPTPLARASAKGLPAADGRQINGLSYMEEVIQAMKQGAYVILPGSRDKDGNFEFELDYLKDDKRGDMYQQRIDKLGVQILRGLWITDRAGTSGGAGGIGTGEADVHAETLAGTLDMIVDEFLDEVLNPQVVDPLVLYNFGEQALNDSQTRVKGAGLSSAMRDLLTKVLLQLMAAEQFTANGKRIPLSARMDGVGIMQQLELPMVSAEEAEKLMPTDEDDPAPDAGGSDADPGDDEDPELEKAVAKRLGKRGVLDSGSREALSGSDAEIFDRLIKEVDLRVASVRTEISERRQGLAAEPDGGRVVPIEVHLHQGDTNVTVPPGQTNINPTIHAAAPPVTVQLGDIHASLELKPGEKKTVELKGPNGERITGQITVKREGE